MPTVKFYAPDWDRETTDRWSADLDAVERYVLAARAVGLDDDEIGEDLTAQYAYLGHLTVETVGGAVWVDIGDFPDLDEDEADSIDCRQ